MFKPSVSGLVVEPSDAGGKGLQNYKKHDENPATSVRGGVSADASSAGGVSPRWNANGCFPRTHRRRTSLMKARAAGFNLP